MPFYGKAEVSVNFWSPVKEVTLTAIGQTKVLSVECGGSIPWGNQTMSISKIPMGSSILITMKAYCDENGNAITATIQIVHNGGSGNTYNIQYLNNQGGWSNHASLKLTAIRPPTTDCDQFTCQTNNFLPNITLEKVENGYMGWELCADCSDYGNFLVPPSDEELPEIIDACFDKQRQKWWFNLSNNHSFKFNYMLELCENNIIGSCLSQKLIENYLNFPTNYSCEEIIRDIKAHLNYGFRGAKYVLKNIIIMHEEEHLKDFKQTVNEYKPLLDNKIIELLSESISCEDFSNSEEAKEFFQFRIETIFFEWRKIIIGMNAAKTRRFGSPEERFDYEIRLHSRLEPYIYAIKFAAELYYNCIIGGQKND